MLREYSEEPAGDTTTVRPAIHGEILPPVSIPLMRFRREVGRVGEDQFESAQARGQIGPNRVDRKSLVAGPSEHRLERRRVQVRRDDLPSSVPCRNEGRQTPSTSNLKHAVAPAWSSEPCEEPRVLAHGVDRGHFPRTRFGQPRRSAPRRAPNTL